jgi:hypothetical protein
LLQHLLHLLQRWLQMLLLLSGLLKQMMQK